VSDLATIQQNELLPTYWNYIQQPHAVVEGLPSVFTIRSSGMAENQVRDANGLNHIIATQELVRELE